LVVLGGAAISNAFAGGVDSSAITKFNQDKIGEGRKINITYDKTNMANIEDTYTS
jgi:PP-loop superfamily ATP-utilizing enzyme